MPLIEYGHCDYGENKVQEAVEKWNGIKKTKKNLRLHMIGKLQTNKVKIALGLFDFIHSLDSIKLAKKISEEQKKLDKNLKIFIQVNIGNESQKSGIAVSELKNFYKVCSEDLNLNIIGLMCIPPMESDPTDYFKKMENLAKDLHLKELSMGMSSDYIKAIEHNSNNIRVGSKIFGLRN